MEGSRATQFLAKARMTGATRARKLAAECRLDSCGIGPEWPKGPRGLALRGTFAANGPRS